MNPRAALDTRIFESRSFRYIPDPQGSDVVESLALDHWETPAEVEARGGADCDGLSIRALVRAAEVAGEGDWYLVAGRVLVRGEWCGHAWVELMTEHDRFWADPTWGELPQTPRALGFPEKRIPVKRWHYDLSTKLFAEEEDYVLGEVTA